MKKFTYLIPILCILLLASCQEENNVVPQTAQDPDLKSIEQTLIDLSDEAEAEELKDDANSRRWGKRPKFRTLITALVKTRLIKTVAINRLTVLAPTDAAFAELGLNPRNIGSVPNLKEILLYHVLEGKIRSTDLTEGYAHTVNGASVRVSLDGGVFFNDAEVILADKWAINGIIHGIDKVLLPPTLVDIVQGNENFSILEEALIKADLVDVLADPMAEFTVFAPTNDAFAALLGELGLTKDQLLGLPNLDQVLLYHVLGGSVFSDNLADGLSVEMANGENITFDLTGAPAIIDVNGRSTTLNTGLLDIKATNGVVHVLNGVLLPTL